MKKILEHQVPFPVDAESDSFTAALVPTLSYEEHTALESVIMDVLDRVTVENAMDTVGMMCGINGVLIEARWHATESCIGDDNLLCNVCTNKEIYN